MIDDFISLIKYWMWNPGCFHGSLEVFPTFWGCSIVLLQCPLLPEPNAMGHFLNVRNEGLREISALSSGVQRSSRSRGLVEGSGKVIQELRRRHGRVTLHLGAKPKKSGFGLFVCLHACLPAFWSYGWTLWEIGETPVRAGLWQTLGHSKVPLRPKTIQNLWPLWAQKLLENSPGDSQVSWWTHSRLDSV